jgi:hypothetical protein
VLDLTNDHRPRMGSDPCFVLQTADPVLRTTAAKLRQYPARGPATGLKLTRAGRLLQLGGGRRDIEPFHASNW